MSISFFHDAPVQRVVFAPGAVARIGEEVAHLKLQRVLVVATPGSGARLGARLVESIGTRAAGLHAEAVIHVPRDVAQAGVDAARKAKADGVVAAGGGSAIGLAKAIAHEIGLPIIAVPTTYSGSEATPIFGTTEGERKVTARDPRVLPRTIVYDPELTLKLPASVSAASGMNAVAHCVEAIWIPERTPVVMAFAMEALRRFAHNLPRVVGEGGDIEARGECLVGAWLAGAALTAGTGLHHKLAHVLGGLGLPHAETHAILLPHVARFNLAGSPEATRRLADALDAKHPADALDAMVQGFPIPQRLRDVGLDKTQIPEVARQAAALGIKEPRAVTVEDATGILERAY
jgi:maleylacetate reductase